MISRPLKYRLGTQLLLGSSLVLNPISIFPVAAAGLVLEEVVVVARKREESLQDTPIAVSAFGTEELRANQINNVGDLSKHVPGLSRRDGRKEADLNIRGVGVRFAGTRVDPGVGVYVDSIFIPRSDSQLVDVLNLESVQVLRGPQGTLFGKNTAGGALLLNTRKPAEEFTGFAQVNLGNLDRQRYRLGLSGPLLGEQLTGSIILDSAREDGYRVDAETGRDYGNVDRSSVMAQLRYQTESVFTGDLMLFWGEVEEHSAPVTCQRSEQGGSLQNFTAAGDARPYTALCDRSFELNDRDKVLMDRLPQPWEMTNRMLGLTLSWELDEYTLKSITGYLHQKDIIQSNDVDATPLFTIQNSVEARRQLEANGVRADGEEREFISQEFQFVGAAFEDFLGYTVGFFASREEIDDQSNGQVIGPGGYLGLPLAPDRIRVLPPGTAGFRGAQVTTYDNESWALFAQGILNFNEQWQLTIGGRYTEEEKEAEQLNFVSASASPGTLTRAQLDALEFAIQEVVPDPENPKVQGDESWSVFTPAITVTYFAPDNWTEGALDSGMFYLSASEGFKAGGFTPFGDEFLPFDPEEILSYELGAKMDMLDRRLRLNAAIYYSEYEDIQLTVTRTIDEFTTLDGIINAAEATITGGEIELSYLPTERLLLGLSGAYIDPEYDEFLDEDSDRNPVDRSNEPFAFVPELTWSLLAQYTWDLAVGSLVSRLNGFYKDEIYLGLDPEAVDEDIAYLDDYWLWNFRLAFSPERVEGLEVAAYVNNLADEEYFASGIISTAGVGAASLIAGKQRTYGLELSYNW